MLHEPGVPITHVYFPVNCVISLLTVMAHGTTAEAASVGNDGVVGLDLLLGSDSAQSRAFCQVSGDALRLPAAAFLEAAAGGGVLAWVLQRAVQMLFNQVAQTAACNRLHRVDQRCARWLLQVQDWVGADEFPLKQEFLALMLSVQRPTVTQVAKLLRAAGAIEYRRGRLQITDRAALEATACECYRVINDQFEHALA